MSRDVNGLYSLPAGNPVVAGTIIESVWANSTMSDVAAALTDSLSRSGAGSMSAPLRLPNGTVALPALSFNNSVGSGLWLAALNDVRMSVGAAEIMRWSAGAVGVTGSFSASSVGVFGLNVTIGGGSGEGGQLDLRNIANNAIAGFIDIDNGDNLRVAVVGNKLLNFFTNSALRAVISGTGIFTGLWNNNGVGNNQTQFNVLTVAQFNAIVTKDTNTVYIQI